jgi:hypothetical protein
MGLAKKYKKSKDEKWFLRFKTYHPEGDSFDGVVTNIKKKHIVLALKVDFAFYGTVVLAKKVIKGYRDGKFEKCANKILHYNGNIEKFKSPLWLEDCDTFKQIIKKLKQEDIWPVVEIIFKWKGKTETLFYLGKITQIKKNKFYIFHYDATGEWEKEYEIYYTDIFKIEFGGLYESNFNDYMRNILPKELKK